jgi:hypothetical protein
VSALVLGTVLLATSCSLITPPAGPPRVVREGQFKIGCGGPVRSAPDDPIVKPGQPGAAHNHEFYGNRSVDAFSSLATMVRAATECAEHGAGDPGDTAGYWHPTLYANGVRRPATESDFYYDTQSEKMGPIRPFPPGLKMLAGDHMAQGPQGTDVVYWGCGNGGSTSKVDRPPQCERDDDGLTLHITFPDCWNGLTLDSPDHKSHVAYSYEDDDDVHRCPRSHPVSIPRLTMVFEWDDFYPDPASLSLSSGSVHTMHADFWNTWDQARLAQLVRMCVDASRKCSSDDVDDLPFPG